jgi:hypothetical protein
MESRLFDWSGQVKQIKSPTELIFADADAIHPAHIAAFYEALGGANAMQDSTGLSVRPPGTESYQEPRTTTFFPR